MDTHEFVPESGPAAAGATGAAGLDPRLAAMMGLLGSPGGAGAAGADAVAALQAQLDQAAARNPQLAPLLQMMRERAARNAAAPAEPAPPAEDDAIDAVHAADVQELLELARQLEQELETLRLRNDALAAALGACHLCFGEHAGCHACRGLGRPGWQRPDAHAFRRYAAPAVRRVQAEAWPAAPRRPSPLSDSAPAASEPRRRPGASHPSESAQHRSTEGLRAAAAP